MVKAILISVLITASSFTIEKGHVNYEHKAVIKTLSKVGNISNPELEEINIPDSLKEQMNLPGKYFQLNEDNSANIKNVYIGRVNSCRAGGCSVSNNNVTGSSEYFDYMICFDGAAAVKYVKVFNYQATHGHEITAKGWLKQFVGYTSDQTLKVGRNVDSISGATISVNGITHDIEQKTELLKKILMN